jgi:hypothetical protein
MDHDPSQIQAKQAGFGAVVPDRRRSFERKLSEYSGYALLILAVAMIAGGLVFVLI